jgi:hypothetical protein
MFLSQIKNRILGKQKFVPEWLLAGLHELAAKEKYPASNLLDCVKNGAVMAI